MMDKKLKILIMALVALIAALLGILLWPGGTASGI